MDWDYVESTQFICGSHKLTFHDSLLIATHPSRFPWLTINSLKSSHKCFSKETFICCFYHCMLQKDPIIQNPINPFDMLLQCSWANAANMTFKTFLFSADLYTFAVPENAAVGTTVGRIMANDGDVGINARMTYSLEDDQEESSTFTIQTDPVTQEGVVLLAKVNKNLFNFNFWVCLHFYFLMIQRKRCSHEVLKHDSLQNPYATSLVQTRPSYFISFVQKI